VSECAGRDTLSMLEGFFRVDPLARDGRTCRDYRLSHQKFAKDHHHST
jgi:hypothetical protein